MLKEKIMNILTKEKFITTVFEKYGDKFVIKYDEYVDRDTPIEINCPEHGMFITTPRNFLRRKSGCPKCQMLTMTTEDFIKQAKKIHGDKYDYLKCVFSGMHEKITLNCPIHGEFTMQARVHLNGGGCYKCKGDKMWDTRGRVTTEEFIEKARKVHGDKYDYSKVEYVNNHTKVCIICHEHGEFWQTPNCHLDGRGCSKCSKVYRGDGTYFIEKAREIHGDKYDYSKVEYKTTNIKVCIICPEHGEFWQSPCLHLKGCGCPECKTSHLENEVIYFLKQNQIEYEYESHINGLLKRQSVDFYLPEYNIAIECQGGQHFYGGFNRGNPEKEEEIHKNVLKRDIRKYKICEENGIKILYYTNIKDLPNDIMSNKKYEGMYNNENFYTKIENLSFVIMPESVSFNE